MVSFLSLPAGSLHICILTSIFVCVPLCVCVSDLYPEVSGDSEVNHNVIAIFKDLSLISSLHSNIIVS